MKTRRVVGSVVLALSTVLLSPAVGSAAKANVPRPLAGHYKILKVYSFGAVGSFVINKKRNAVLHLTLTPTKGYNCPTTVMRIHGPLRLHNVADADGGASDNSPDWSVTHKNGTTRRVSVSQGGKTFHGQLSLGLGSKNGTKKPVKYAVGGFDSPNCSFTLGAKHV